MANILFCVRQGYIDDDINAILPFYRGMINKLTEYGNDVLFVNINEFDNKKHIQEVINFSPNVIFAFNNTINETIIKNTNCKIVLFDADDICYYDNLKLIAKYKDRYYVASFYDKWIDYTAELGIQKNKICYIHPATTIKAENIEINKNISFIGTSFDFPYINYLHKNRDIAECLRNTICNDLSVNQIKLVNENFPAHNLTNQEIYALSDARVACLASLIPFGLNIFGTNWEKYCNDFAMLYMAKQNKNVVTIEDTQNIYNSSRISFNINHPQARGYAYSWRCYDIMASNSVLVSSYSELLSDRTKKYFELPLFKNIADLQGLCAKFLKDDEKRLEIIRSSQEFIEEHGRWDDNIIKLQDAFDINLSDKTQKGYYRKIQRIEYKFKRKNRNFKQIINGVNLILLNIPIFEKVFPRKLQEKLYKSIEKYKEVGND